MFIAFRLTMAVPSSSAVAWLSPQVQLSGNEFDGDGKSVSVQSCPGVCWTQNVKVTDTGNTDKSAVTAGTATFSVDGNYFTVNFQAARGFQITKVDVALGTDIPNASYDLWPFHYTVDNTQVTDAYNPLGIITSNSFSVMYDLSIPIATQTGPRVGCGGQLQYAFSAKVRKDSQTTRYTAALSKTISSPGMFSSNQSNYQKLAMTKLTAVATMCLQQRLSNATILELVIALRSSETI
jgi:hypothetical protein